MSGGEDHPTLDAAALLADAATRRWYGANDQQAVRASIVGHRRVEGAEHLRWVLLGVTFASGEEAVYQLVVDGRSGQDALARPEVLRWLFPALAVGEVRELGGEQSNTSLVVDGSVIVKVFRRLGAVGERNPDVEVTEALWAHGFRAVAEPMGHAERDVGHLRLRPARPANEPSGRAGAQDRV